MTINIKLTVPVYKSNEYGCVDRKADIQIAGDFNSLSEGYAFLRVEIDQLLKQSQAENTLLLNLHDLEREISKKQNIIERLDKKSLSAKSQLQKLENFLRRLGIEPGAYKLYIADKPVMPSIVVGSNDDDDNDDDDDDLDADVEM